MDTIDLAQEEQAALNMAVLNKFKNKKTEPQMINGKHVICKRCLKPIPKKRLKAIPDAVTCVSCAEKIAQGHTYDDYDPEEED